MPRVPDEILRSLPDNELEGAVIQAYAAIGSAPGTSLGETHLIVADERLYGVGRVTPWDPLIPMQLDPSGTPELDPRGYETWLVLAAMDAEPLRIGLSPFDMDGVESVMAAIASRPPPAPEPAPPASDPDPPAPATATASPTAKTVGPAAAPSAALAPPAGDLDAKIDDALDRIERVGTRAGLRSALTSVRVRADVPTRDGDLQIEVVYDRASLARLAARSQEPGEPPE